MTNDFAPVDANALDYLGAISLALEGAADDATALKIISELMETAPGPDGSSTIPVKLLLLAIKQLNGSFITP